ncbi:hypothetical protein EYF80_031705 [Liparis tanakae]|uniref:Secreted protein n=1 Tax=Liparis tanakae TaxID=230148 RepID=A0A4Z2GX54_9TELE|nr:hypothetical protein EYF80_031705 [Liparis tanakae]
MLWFTLFLTATHRTLPAQQKATTLLKATLQIVVELMQPSVLLMASQLQTEGIHGSELLCRQRFLCDGRGDAKGLRLRLKGPIPAAQQAVLVPGRRSVGAGRDDFPLAHVQAP